MYLQSATLMTWLGEELITVPNFPAWICDICGYRAYDSHALAQLSMLLNEDAGKPIMVDFSKPETQPPLQSPPPA